MTIVGAILVLVGALWTLQGMNLVGGSFMTGQSPWIVIGLATMIAGAVLITISIRRSRRP